VLVRQVLPGTPAIGKLEPGDIITEVNGKNVESVQELRNAIAAMPPGEQVKMMVFRNGQTQDIALKLAEQPDNVLAMRNVPRDERKAPKDTSTSASALGIKVQTLTPEISKRLGASVESGAIVTNITRNSP